MIPIGTQSYNFNPRSREGSDGPRSSIRHPWQYFNPRSREGSDLALLIAKREIEFQSTLP